MSLQAFFPSIEKSDDKEENENRKNILICVIPQPFPSVTIGEHIVNGTRLFLPSLP